MMNNMNNMNTISNTSTPKKLLACAKCYKLHRKCTGESRPCDYCKERKLECVENPDRKKRGRPKGSKNKFKSTPNGSGENNGLNYELQSIMEIQKKRSLNNTSYAQYSNNMEDPRMIQEYQKRQKLISNENNYPIQYTSSIYSIPPQTSNNLPSYMSQQPIYHTHQQEYYPQQNSLQQYNGRGMINANLQQEILYDNHFPSNEYPTIYTPNESNQINNHAEIHQQQQMQEEPRYNIPINHQRRDLIFNPENISSDNNKPAPTKCCGKCQTEMLTFKFCPQCGTPREKSVEQKSLAPAISRKKLLSMAILEIVSENDSSTRMINSQSSLQTLWFVVKHPSRKHDNFTEETDNSAAQFSLLSTSIKQVSPSWSSFLGYKVSESEKTPLMKFVPSKAEISPKSFSQWDNLFEYTSRSSTVNYSCEFALCHKFGLTFGVELQITCFTKNGLPDTSFAVIKRHWNLSNMSEASFILNNPRVEVLSDKAILNDEEEEEDDEPTINDPNFELLRKVVDPKSIDTN